MIEHNAISSSCRCACPHWPDQDLWKLAAQIFSTRTIRSFRFRGIPSHLDEDPAKRQRYKQLFDAGQIEQSDIVGNAGADRLAAEGADTHTPCLRASGGDGRFGLWVWPMAGWGGRFVRRVADMENASTSYSNVS